MTHSPALESKNPELVSNSQIHMVASCPELNTQPVRPSFVFGMHSTPAGDGNQRTVELAGELLARAPAAAAWTLRKRLSTKDKDTGTIHI